MSALLKATVILLLAMVALQVAGMEIRTRRQVTAEVPDSTSPSPDKNNPTNSSEESGFDSSEDSDSEESTAAAGLYNEINSAETLKELESLVLQKGDDDPLIVEQGEGEKEACRGKDKPPTEEGETETPERYRKRGNSERNGRGKKNNGRSTTPSTNTEDLTA